MYEVTDNGVLKSIESWMLFIPAKDNDGKPFSPAVIDEILQKILLSFPGFTVTSTVGYWKERSEVYEDQNYEIVIDAVPDPKHDSSEFFIQLKTELQHRLSQEKIYLTKQDSKKELLTFAEFFEEVGLDGQTNNLKEEAQRISKELALNFGFVLQRLGYETTTLARNAGAITWERKLCGVKLTTRLKDSLPPDVRIIAADRVSDLASALASERPFALIGAYEFHSFILQKQPHRPLIEPDGKFPANDRSFLSPWGQPLSTRRFIEEFTMSVFTSWLLLRDEGFLTNEISMNVGKDGSLQWTTGKRRPNVLLHSPAAIDEDEIQKEIIRCLAEAAKSYERNSLDPVAVLQSKAKNNYILKRAIVRHIIEQSAQLQ